MKAIGTALIGYGFSGSTFHAPFLNKMEEFQLVSILSSKREKLKESFPSIDVVQQIDDVLNNAQVELVVVTTPSSLHFDITKRALEAGKHVIVEKPMVPTVQEAETLAECAKKHNVMLSVFQNRRYDGNFLTVRKMIEEGRLGDVYVYEAHYDRFEPVIARGWREEKKPASGVLYDLGAHLIDQALSLFGMPDSVTADIQKQRPQALVDDYFHLVLTYGTKRVILHSGMITVEQGAKYKVHGTKGTFMKRGEDPQEKELINGESLESPEWGMDRIDQYGTLYTKEGDEKIVTLPGDYRRYYKEIYQCIRDGKPCPVSGEEGIQVIRVIEAALESSRDKRTIEL
ncbi:oxidoreductase [Domibacillus sp. PGB-M46]|uniref:oxidoreductase n=1 Tax=Domibacillus sp. PGB-M46 TaxID=2910255 RepID=UPI001F573B88|nr:oxidoreductase [Domibacillus sp. PGB-M46]MCI2252876.1 oxidoreductase [Domibacillus sp. PGB-M46]